MYGQQVNHITDFKKLNTASRQIPHAVITLAED